LHYIYIDLVLLVLATTRGRMLCWILQDEVKWQEATTRMNKTGSVDHG